MAKTISDEEIQLRKKARRRLIGSIALVLLAAVLLPMVLDKEPKPLRQDISIEIPKPDSSGFTSIVVPITQSKTDDGSTPTQQTDPVKQTTPALAPAPNAAATKLLTMSEKLETKPVITTPRRQDAKPVVAEPKSLVKTEKPKPTDSAKVLVAVSKPVVQETTPTAGSNSGTGFVVQLGAFSSAANAKQLQQKLSTNGIKSYIDTLQTPKGTKTRVRAGPFASREVAEKAQARLKTMGLNGIIAEKQ